MLSPSFVFVALGVFGMSWPLWEVILFFLMMASSRKALLVFPQASSPFLFLYAVLTGVTVLPICLRLDTSFVALTSAKVISHINV